MDSFAVQADSGPDENHRLRKQPFEEKGIFLGYYDWSVHILCRLTGSGIGHLTQQLAVNVYHQ